MEQLYKVRPQRGGQSKDEAKERKVDPGPEEAASDPSTSEESESSEECDDPPVQVQPTDMEQIACKALQEGSEKRQNACRGA